MLHFGPTLAKDRRVSFGKRGEDLACEELRRQGYAILERRFRTRFGEIDIVARDGAVIAFVEVKARSSGTFGTPLESITWQKRRRLGRMAAQYLSWKKRDHASCRFDVVAITEDANVRIEVIRNAFDLTA